MKTHRGSHLFILALAAALPLGAQTSSKTTVTKPRSTAATEHRAAGGCLTPPAISPKIPALPAGSPCAKALYTMTSTSSSKLDYASPLLSKEVREGLGGGAQTYSLEYVDTKVGTGELAKAGKWLTVHYTGYLAEEGTKFDSSHDHPGGEPISFPYGTHQVIQGWDTGFEGMRIGGKRRLFIPYELGYGEAGHRPVIPAKADLIFDVELVGQSDQRPSPPAAPRPSVMPTPKPGAPGGRPGAPPASTPQSGTAAPGGTNPPAGMPKPGTSAPAGATPPAGMPQPGAASSGTTPPAGMPQPGSQTGGSTNAPPGSTTTKPQ